MSNNQICTKQYKKIGFEIYSVHTLTKMIPQSENSKLYDKVYICYGVENDWLECIDYIKISSNTRLSP